MTGEKQNFHSTPWGIGIFVAVMLYTLSWGPVMAHYQDPYATFGYSRMPKFMKKFYAPVDWLRGYSRPVLRATDDYWNWCYLKMNGPRTVYYFQ